MSRQDYRRRYPGMAPVRAVDHPALLSIRVENLADCESLLKSNGVKVTTPDSGRLLVPPLEAADLTVEFREN